MSPDQRKLRVSGTQQATPGDMGNRPGKRGQAVDLSQSLWVLSRGSALVLQHPLGSSGVTSQSPFPGSQLTNRTGSLTSRGRCPTTTQTHGTLPEPPAVQHPARNRPRRRPCLPGAPATVLQKHRPTALEPHPRAYTRSLHKPSAARPPSGTHKPLASPGCGLSGH